MLSLFTCVEWISHGKKFTPLLSSVRYRRPNTKRPINPVLEKAIYLKLSKPIVPLDPLPKPYRIHEETIAEQFNPYEELLAKKVMKPILKADMLIIVHRNSFDAQALRKFQVTCLREELEYIQHPRNVMIRGFSNTYLEPLSCLLIGWEGVIIGSREKLKTALKLIRMNPDLFPLCGVIDSNVHNKVDLENISKLPDLTTLRAQLCHSLSSVGTKLLSTISHPLTDLSQNLVTYSGTDNKQK